MRLRPALLAALVALAGLLAAGCSSPVPSTVRDARDDQGLLSMKLPVDHAKGFEEAQKRYTSNIRFGLFDDALPMVEPELQPRFREAMHRLRELRLSDAVIESVDIDADRTHATARVTYRGYFLSSPFEREVRVEQRWRREAPGATWYVTPPLDTLLDPAG